MIVNSKKDIKCLIVFGDNNSYVKAHKLNNNIYYGLPWDYAKAFKEKLKDKYNFKFDFTDKKDNNYDNFVNNVKDGKYDICIGLFTRTAERTSIINYTLPIIIDANSIIHFSEDNFIIEYFTIITKVLKYFFILLIFGILSGLILYYFDKNRMFHMTRDKTKINYLFRAIITGISTYFGEAGYLSERSSLNIMAIFILSFTMIVSTLTLMFIQSKITNILIKNNENSYDIKNIQSKTFLAFKGYAVANIVEKFKTKIKYIENINQKELFKKYKNNQNKYDGIILSYLDAFTFLQENPNLIASNNFGFEPKSFIINKNRIDLLNDINIELLKMKDNLEMFDICKKYFGMVKDVPTCKLK